MTRIAAAVWPLSCLLAASFATAQSPPCPVTSLVIDPSNTSVLYAIGAGALFASSDAGATWRLLYGGISSGALTIDPRDSRHLFLSTGKALVESRNSGLSWTELAVPQTPGGTILVTLAGVAIDRFDGSPYVVAYYRPVTGIVRGNILYKSVDGGQTWRPLLAGPGLTAPILDRSSARRLLIGVYGYGGPVDPSGASLPGGIFMSEDSGLTWSTSPATSSSGPWGRDLVTDPVSSNSLHAEVACDTYTSSDGGRNWAVFPSRNDCRVGYLVSGPLEVFANGIAGVLISPDASLAWQTFLPPGNTLLAVDSSNGKVLYVSRGSALLKSVDGGRTFNALCETPDRPEIERSGPRSPAKPVTGRN
jgi:photosystem II stability/assembly factor-like uncharacterized protein